MSTKDKELNNSNKEINIDEKEKMLLKEQRKNVAILISIVVITVLLVVLSIAFHVWVGQTIGFVQVAEVFLLMLLIIAFVVAGFKYTDTRDKLKVIQVKKSKGIE